MLNINCSVTCHSNNCWPSRTVASTVSRQSSQAIAPQWNESLRYWTEHLLFVMYLSERNVSSMFENLNDTSQLTVFQNFKRSIMFLWCYQWQKINIVFSFAELLWKMKTHWESVWVLLAENKLTLFYYLNESCLQCFRSRSTICARQDVIDLKIASNCWCYR